MSSNSSKFVGNLSIFDLRSVLIQCIGFDASRLCFGLYLSQGLNSDWSSRYSEYGSVQGLLESAHVNPIGSIVAEKPAIEIPKIGLSDMI